MLPACLPARAKARARALTKAKAKARLGVWGGAKVKAGYPDQETRDLMVKPTRFLLSARARMSS